MRRFKRADQDRAGTAFMFANKVQAPVDAVGSVDVGVARRAEHHRIAFGTSDVRVRCRLGVVVGFDFDDRAANTVDEQSCADEFGRNLVHRAVEK